MSPFFQERFIALKGIEGRYVNDPADSGGETNWGITIAVARAFGYLGPMRDMSIDTARSIYLERYWDYMRLEDVAALSKAVAGELFDSGVNCGQAVAGGWLQAALNAFNQQGTLYNDIKIDGGVGRMTLHALKRYFEAHARFGVGAAERVLMRALNAQQGDHYLRLAWARPKDERFAFGWFLNRVE
jgi:lysozyme family protein